MATTVPVKQPSPTTVVVFMRIGWSDKQAAIVLGISESKVSQALTPAVEKFAKLWLANPTNTMHLLLASAAEIQAERRLPNVVRKRSAAELSKMAAQLAAEIKQERIELKRRCEANVDP